MTSKSSAPAPPPLWVSMLEGSAATMGAAGVSHPFETIKTRLQLQGELQRRTASNTHYRGTLHGLVTIVRNEGVLALYKGIVAAMWYQFVMNGIRLGLYDELKRTIGGVIGDGNTANLAAGVGTGFAGNFTASPFFLVKTRQQSRSAAIAVGAQHEYTGCFAALRQVATERGVWGMWQGALPGAFRTGVGSGVQLASYDATKRYAQRVTGWDASESRLHFLSSFMCSGVVAVAMNPFDVVMTRIYNTPADAKREYSANFVAAFTKIVRAEGIQGVFKGTGALWARVGPHTICTFVFLERIRSARSYYWPQMTLS